jgi:predicted transcriptional regulator of viral defense system
MGRGLFRFPDQGLPDDVEAVRIVAHHLGTDAVASHVTALFVHACTDIIPERWEFIVPREKRYITRRGIRIHTTKEPLPLADVTDVRGLRVTTLTRSILDAAKTIRDPSQIEIAIYEGITKGLLRPEELFARRVEAGRAWWPIESGLRKYARLASTV